MSMSETWPWVTLALLGAFFWLWIHPERAIDLGEEAAALPQETLVVEGKPRV